MTFLTREAILGARDLGAEEVEVPEWGGRVRIRVMTGTERDQFETAVMQAREATSPANIRALLAALTLCDAEGNALFSPADVADLGRKSAAALERVFAVAARLNAMADKDVAALGKDSAATPSAASTSSLPSGSA